MNLTNKEKRNLRNYTQERLKAIPVGQKVTLDKQILDILLFNSFITHNNLPRKIVIWSGEFLRKLDLQEVSFANVDWDMANLDINLTAKQQEEIYEELRETLLSRDNQDYLVDLSDTNANIDFSQAFNQGQHISCCNFTNLDLSTAHAEQIHTLTDVNLSNSGAKLALKHITTCKNSKLNQLDLTEYTLTEQEITNNGSFHHTSFTDTGINLQIDMHKVNHLKDLELSILLHYFDGCTINGQYFNPTTIPDQLTTNENKQLKELYTSVDTAITTTINKIKKKRN